MEVEDVFDTIIYPNLKAYLEADLTYTPKVVKVYPQESKTFPIISVRLLPVTNRYNNLSYGEETFVFSIDIDIFAIDGIYDKERIPKKTICDYLTKLTVEYIKQNYHFKIRVKHDANNVDESVHRNQVRLSGTLDTKYPNLVIYPW